MSWVLQVKHKLREARTKLKSLKSAAGPGVSFASEPAGSPVNAMPTTSTGTRAHCVNKQPETSEQDAKRQVGIVGGRSSGGSGKPYVQQESKLNGNPHPQPCWSGIPVAACSKPRPRSHRGYEAPGQHASQAPSSLNPQEVNLHGLKWTPHPAVGEIAMGSADWHERVCVVCMEGPSHVKFLPCGHLVTCKLCAVKVFNQKGECPMCRGRLQGLIMPSV